VSIFPDDAAKSNWQVVSHTLELLHVRCELQRSLNVHQPSLLQIRTRVFYNEWRMTMAR
jgi:hypothetical protein